VIPQPSIPTQARGGKGGKDINPNDVGLLSIPKQTKFFVEQLRQLVTELGSELDF